MISILKFTKFIDMYNYYPLKMEKIKDKNDSNELSYIMSSNTHGSYKSNLNNPPRKHRTVPTDPELVNLLSIISGKIYERFNSCQ